MNINIKLKNLNEIINSRLFEKTEKNIEIIDNNIINHNEDKDKNEKIIKLLKIIKDFREEFNLSEKDYSNEILSKVLIKSKYNINKAFELLFTNTKNFKK